MKEAGYVYILTNPSFKEDWVKIGKSSRPVDIRSKELDNTAVPLPFEIYATLKTVKYEEVERLVHKTIDRLTDLRIRQNREFFNVPPAKALDIYDAARSGKRRSRRENPRTDAGNRTHRKAHP
ncbi:MAG: GIY-YIG nuclease family protein [Alistipes sp.]|nr:GIY-YIG nuclease family protein [Alistipes sp.]